MLGSVADGGPTLNQHWNNDSCLLAIVVFNLQMFSLTLNKLNMSDFLTPFKLWVAVAIRQIQIKQFIGLRVKNTVQALK